MAECRRQAEADLIEAAQRGDTAAVKRLTSVIEDTTYMLSALSYKSAVEPATATATAAAATTCKAAEPTEEDAEEKVQKIEKQEMRVAIPLVEQHQQQQQQQQRPATPREIARTSQEALMRVLAGDTRVLVEGPPEIPSAEIELGARIGGGTFGAVYRGRVRGKLVAVKVPNRQDLSAEKRAAFLREMAIMKTIFHQNVVLFLGACVEPGRLMIVTELMSCDLDHLIHGRARSGGRLRSLRLKEKLQIAQDTALGLNWLHGICHIIHRDLKPANILVNESMHAKVTDFGFSELLREGDRHVDTVGANGTMLYMAPEVMLFQAFDNSVDIYAFGLILYELVTECDLFAQYTTVEALVDAVARRRQRPSLNLSGVPRSLIDLINRCWQHNPRLRPKCPEVIDELDRAAIDVITSPEYSSTTVAVVTPSLSPFVPPPTTTATATSTATAVKTKTRGTAAEQEGRGANAAAEFWKRYFVRPFQEEIPWVVFETLVCQHLGVAPIVLERVKASITKSSSGPLRAAQQVVSLTDFNLYYQWFGNFFDPPDGQRALREMNRVLGSPWFHGAITQDEAHARLSQQSDKTFLVRFSFKNPVRQPFTISRMKNGYPVHKRINRTAAQPASVCCYTVPMSDGSTRSAATVCDLIALLQAEGNLGAACPKQVRAPRNTQYSVYPS